MKLTSAVILFSALSLPAPGAPGIRNGFGVESLGPVAELETDSGPGEQPAAAVGTQSADPMPSGELRPRGPLVWAMALLGVAGAILGFVALIFCLAGAWAFGLPLGLGALVLVGGAMGVRVVLDGKTREAPLPAAVAFMETGRISFCMDRVRPPDGDGLAECERARVRQAADSLAGQWRPAAGGGQAIPIAREKVKLERLTVRRAVLQESTEGSAVVSVSGSYLPAATGSSITFQEQLFSARVFLDRREGQWYVTDVAFNPPPG